MGKIQAEKIPPRPTNGEVAKWLNIWNTADNMEKYRLQESALAKLFHETYSNNTDLDEILIKVAALNDFYSTQIRKVYVVAKHIKALNIDARLKAGDPLLVRAIASVQVTDDKSIDFYSFASKYCSHHNAEDYPIYDSFVDKVLRYFREVDGFYKFENIELKYFDRYIVIMQEFIKFYGLTCNLKDLDRYLWQLGKDCFPKKYY